MSPPPERPSSRRRPVLLLVNSGAVVALVLAALLGGIAATTLFPTSVDTLNYEARLRLSVSPANIGTISSPTLFGDILLEFAGPVPVPGVIADVQVKQRITDLLARPNISVSSLQPGPLELERAARDAAIGLALRFMAGALFVTLLAVGAYAEWIHRRPKAGRLGVAALCWLVACGATFASIAFGYRPERLDQFTTTGILGAVQRNADLLAGVETRAAQTTPYLKNLLALSAALQDKYSPQSLNEPVAARLLLVSDIHGGNQYPLMKTIVEQEQVDAVIDAGDLVNFGTLTEAEASGVLAGIRSLDVPYLFVKGNHDARSATDTELLRALAKIPNVVLLQPDDDSYTVQSIGGIRIAGFNDPRWFGDDNKNNAAKQKAPAARYVAAMADLAPPDILVAHEPGAVNAVAQESGIKIHGHLHSDRLNDNTIGVGTFTGGGPFSHFLQAAEGEELTGQPSSFDIAVFGEDCRITSLSRYQFRNVIEGRPAYDDVTLINGARIQSALPEVPAPADANGGGGYHAPADLLGGPGADDRTRRRACPVSIVPILRVADAAAALPWWERLGFEHVHSHRFADGMPVFMTIRRGADHVFLSEHLGDAVPGGLIYLWVEDVDAVAREFGTPVDDNPWARDTEVVDPDGNRVRVGQPR